MSMKLVHLFGVIILLCTPQLYLVACTPNLVRHGGNHLMEYCNKSTDCSYSKHPLVCKEGMCMCDPQVSKLVMRSTPQKIRECVGIGNKPCVDFKCIDNAACLITPGENGQHALTCRCLATNHVTDIPVKLNNMEKCTYHDVTCDNWNKCEFGRVCMDGICQCPNPNHQYFNGTACVSKIGGPCTYYPTSAKETVECAPYATCDWNSGKSRCACPEDMVENEDGQCDLGFGNWCSNVQYGNMFKNGVYTNRPCGNNLKCIDGVCKCQDDFHVHDFNLKKCRGMPGAHCTSATMSGKQGGGEVSNTACVVGAHCVPITVSSSKGICKCLPDLEESKGKCVRPRDAYIVMLISILFLLISLAMGLTCQVWFYRRRIRNNSPSPIVTFRARNGTETGSDATRDADNVSFSGMP
ncbi:unnamed protein product [Orchesella dallaii]|uniref:EB domain-containing protein n=1 Tax=Orchesella dallaii TaxID=48710 RepID=A0ABP1R8Z1_9HEXA